MIRGEPCPYCKRYVEKPCRDEDEADECPTNDEDSDE